MQKPESVLYVCCKGMHSSAYKKTTKKNMISSMFLSFVFVTLLSVRYVVIMHARASPEPHMYLPTRLSFVTPGFPFFFDDHSNPKRTTICYYPQPLPELPNPAWKSSCARAGTAVRRNPCHVDVMATIVKSLKSKHILYDVGDKGTTELSNRQLQQVFENVALNKVCENTSTPEATLPLSCH